MLQLVPYPPHAQHCDDSEQYATLFVCETQCPLWSSHANPSHSPYSRVEEQPGGHDQVPSSSESLKPCTRGARERGDASADDREDRRESAEGNRQSRATRARAAGRAGFTRHPELGTRARRQAFELCLVGVARHARDLRSHRGAVRLARREGHLTTRREGRRRPTREREQEDHAAVGPHLASKHGPALYVGAAGESHRDVQDSARHLPRLQSRGCREKDQSARYS